MSSSEFLKWGSMKFIVWSQLLVSYCRIGAVIKCVFPAY